MCERHPDRDERGRLLPGHSGNPAGRPVRRPYLRLLEAAQELGADGGAAAAAGRREGADGRPAPEAA